MKTILSTLLMVTGLTAYANECNFNNIQSTSPVEKFLDNNDGTVTDLRFGLTWTKCTFGQEYNVSDKTCVGEGKALNTWSDAIDSQTDINQQSFAGYDDWRLPNIKELQSIVERACKNPAIRPEVFPDSINAPYWSNTPDGTVNDGALGRVVDFVDGTEFLKATNVNLYVRHVRSIND